MQPLFKLPLRALEFTDVEGHRKTPAHQHSLNLIRDPVTPWSPQNRCFFTARDQIHPFDPN